MNPLLEWGLKHSDPETLRRMGPEGRSAEDSAKLLQVRINLNRSLFNSFDYFEAIKACCL